MRRLLCAVVATFGVLLAAPLAQAQTVGAPLQVRTGEIYTLNIDATSTTAIGETNVDAALGYVFAVQIVDAEQRLWHYTPVRISYDFPSGLPEAQTMAGVDWAAISDAFSAMTRIGADVGFTCRVDEYGRCREMTNWPFWSARLENLVLMADAFLRLAPSTPVAAAPTPAASGGKNAAQTSATPDWATLRAPVLQGIARLIDGFDTRDAGASMAWLYQPAGVQGRTLTRRQNVAVVDDYEMPFGAPPLRLTGTMRLDRIDSANNVGVVVRRVSLDRASVQASAAGLTQAISEALVQPLAQHFPEGEQPPSVEFINELIGPALERLSYQETTTGMVDLTSGMARETTTDYVLTFAPESGGDPDDAMVARGRIVTRMTLGAPETPRLPRQQN